MLGNMVREKVRMEWSQLLCVWDWLVLGKGLSVEIVGGRGKDREERQDRGRGTGQQRRN